MHKTVDKQFGANVRTRRNCTISFRKGRAKLLPKNITIPTARMLLLAVDDDNNRSSPTDGTSAALTRPPPTTALAASSSVAVDSNSL